MQIKTTLTFHFTPIGIAIIKTTNNYKSWQGYLGGMGGRDKESLCMHCWWECK
jgi:hypothetical protein